jgi:phenylalanine-4-hydroxylase
MPDLGFVPEYLRPFIAKQDTNLYTPMDHASWRFILRVSKDFFAKQAHQKYLAGLKETGISTERIPLIEEMDAKLKKFGWRAVAVSGFIPPAVFMEFQSLGILPIACEMRTLEHLAYTPAPDIVHEAAGHAPIIADPEFAEYLKNYGEVSRKAIFSSQDMAVYEAVRNLSVVKEDPHSTDQDILKAQRQLDETSAAVNYVSEATLLARMNWWTVEYGLVGSIENPKIYGAGLLSSVGESFNCLNAEVKKVPLTIDAVNTIYDITRPQPQLFVTPDFKYLTQVLNEFSKTMAFKIGGTSGLAKALQAASVCTATLDSGIQISGVLSAYRIQNRTGEPRASFLRFKGPTQLSYTDLEIKDQGPENHLDGFSTIIGKIKNRDQSVSDLTDVELMTLKTIEFESGITLQGEFVKSHRENGKALIVTFRNCTVKSEENEILFDPSWGIFDLACGDEVISVFGGAADRKKYLTKTGGFKQSPQIPKCNLTEENKTLNQLYARVRELREQKASGHDLDMALTLIQKELDKDFPEDWLLRLELLELAGAQKINPNWVTKLKSDLDRIALLGLDKKQMIQRGLALL